MPLAVSLTMLPVGQMFFTGITTRLTIAANKIDAALLGVGP